MTKRYEEWTPEPFDPGDDALSAHVGDQEDRYVLRDPEIDARPKIVHVGNRAPQPRPADIERTPFDPNPPYVDRIELRSHLKPQAPSTDRHGDDTLNREAAR